MCYISEARAAVERLHRCKAIYVETVPVSHHKTGNKLGDLNVEIFALEGCSEADCCFVWSHLNGEKDKLEFTSVPAVYPIVTPSKAVLAVLEWEAKMAKKRL